ncbi:MAG TPA: hypothetical protein VH702_21400 [Vicinamibacterales bacterium]|jgi:hypothetical protein
MSQSVFQKLNLKDHADIVVLNAPDSFEPELSGLRGVRVRKSLSGVSRIFFSLAFVTRQQEVDALGKAIAKLAEGDAIVWFAYPKGSSKRYTCDVNRDTGWKILGAAGFEGVRMVAIDEDWSAVRFRRVEFIKTMDRDVRGAMSKVGKARTTRRRR